MRDVAIAAVMACLAPVAIVVDGAGAIKRLRWQRWRPPVVLRLRDGHQLGRVVPSVVLLHHVEPEARGRRAALQVMRSALAVIGAAAAAAAAGPRLPMPRGRGARGAEGGGGIDRDLRLICSSPISSATDLECCTLQRRRGINRQRRTMTLLRLLHLEVVHVPRHCCGGTFGGRLLTQHEVLVQAIGRHLVGPHSTGSPPPPLLST